MMVGRPSFVHVVGRQLSHYSLFLFIIRVARAIRDVDGKLSEVDERRCPFPVAFLRLCPLSFARLGKLSASRRDSSFSQWIPVYLFYVSHVSRREEYGLLLSLSFSLWQTPLKYRTAQTRREPVKIYGRTFHEKQRRMRSDEQRRGEESEERATRGIYRGKNRERKSNRSRAGIFFSRTPPRGARYLSASDRH